MMCGTRSAAAYAELMAVRSKLLVSALFASSGASLIYTVPAGETVLVKRIQIVNGGTTGTSVQYVSYDDGVGGPTIYTHVASVAQGQGVDLETWLALPAGYELSILRTQGGISVTMSGAELEGIAD